MAKKKNKIRIPSAPKSWNKRAWIYIKGNKCSRNPLSASTMEQEWQCWESTCMSHYILAVLPILSIFSSNLRVHSKQLGIQHSDQRTTWRGHRLRSNSNCHQRSHTNSLKRCCWLLHQCWWETEAANSNGDSFYHVWTIKFYSPIWDNTHHSLRIMSLEPRLMWSLPILKRKPVSGWK